MIPYWILFIMPAWVALLSPPLKFIRPDGKRPLRIDGIWILVTITLTLVIGFRYEVGGDWGSYLRYFSGARDLELRLGLLTQDPGFIIVNKLANTLNLGYSGVNAISALIFSFGLVLFCRSLPRPWLALACSIPYLVIVVSMGYTRQSIALGLVMVGLVMLARSHYKTFIIWIFVAATFHKSAVLMLPVAAFSVTRNRWLSILITFLGAFLAFTIFLAEVVTEMMRNYTDEHMISSGAPIRLAMNALPALFFLLYRNHYRLSLEEKKLWTVISFMSLCIFIGLFISDVSTALDRVALYFIPLQLISFAYLPDALGRSDRLNQVIVAGILFYYATVLLIWLNFATHSGYWLPYQAGFV